MEKRNKQNKLKITYLALSEKIPSKHAGTVHVCEMINEFKKLGFDVNLYCKQGYPKLKKIYYTEFPTGFKQIFSPKIFKGIKNLNILKNLYSNKPNIIYERWAHPDIFSYILHNKLNIPRILEVNSPYSEEIHNIPILYSISKYFRKKQFMKSDAIITQTKTLASILNKITKTPVYVIPNGVDTNKFKSKMEMPEEFKKIKDINKKIIITFVGSFQLWHGVQNIPDIAREIISKNKNVIFILIGDGKLFNEIKDEIKGDLEKNVLLLGSKEYNEIPNFLANSDILIAPFNASYYPSFKHFDFWWCPIKLFEYMSAGKPIVSYNYKEVREIIGKNNFLAKRGDIYDFADKLKLLINNKRLRKKIGLLNRKLAVKKYTWKEAAKKTEIILKKVLKEHNQK